MLYSQFVTELTVYLFKMFNISQTSKNSLNKHFAVSCPYLLKFFVYPQRVYLYLNFTLFGYLFVCRKGVPALMVLGALKGDPKGGLLNRDLKKLIFAVLAMLSETIGIRLGRALLRS